MIAGITYQSSGMGNQLARYVAIRVFSLDKGLEWGMKYIANDSSKEPGFKGSSFMSIDMGKPVEGLVHEFTEERVNNDQGVDIRGYDWQGVLNLKDNTLVDGEFQGELYFEHHLDEIREWLKVEPLDMSDDLCVIGFRGGEYRGVPDLFLPQEYWNKAIAEMRSRHPGIRFEVHTDDVDTARAFFPEFPCIHDIALNWRSVRYAKHLIIANSSFFILPSLLGDAEEILAPLHWAGRNVGYWKMNQNQYKRFTYL